MNIKENQDEVQIYLTKDELIELIREKHVSNRPGKKCSAYGKSIPRHISVTFSFQDVSPEAHVARQESLKKAKTIPISEVIEDFKSTMTTPENSTVVTRVVNVLQTLASQNGPVQYLSCVLALTNRDFARTRHLGDKAINLFELYLKMRGHRFAYIDEEVHV